MRRRRFLGLMGGAVCAGAVRATAVPLAVADGDDLEILARAFTLHPGLHRYLTPDALEGEWQQLRRHWREDASRQGRYLALSRFLAAIRCGHTYCNFFNQSAAVAADLFDRQTRLPFHFRWVDQAMVVTRGFATGLEPGSVIESVDGRPAAELGRLLLPYVRTDGHNEAKRVSLLEVRGDDRIETFDVFQGLLAPPRGARFLLRVRAPDGTARQLEVPAIGLAERRTQMQADPRPDAPAWQWKLRDDGVALLTMPGWALWNSSWDWKGWLDTHLEQTRDARGVVIDLRDNEGGEDCGDRILARWIDRPFEPPHIEQRLRFRRTPAALDPYLDTWDDSFRTLGESARAIGDGFYLRPAGADALRIVPALPRLRCPLRVLISPVNSSATFQFAANVRALGVGLLVGRPTGGNRRGINGGCFFFVRLPQSGIEFDLPLVGYFPTVPQPDAGLLPDIEAAPGTQDIATGRDVELERALASIPRSSAPPGHAAPG